MTTTPNTPAADFPTLYSVTGDVKDINTLLVPASALSSTPVAEPKPQILELDFKQATELLEMYGGESAEGWKLVPVVPTDSMRDAGNVIVGSRSKLFAAWIAYQWALADADRTQRAAPVSEAVAPTQDPKYGLRDGRLVNTASGEVIPLDEPVFLFRARDKVAVHALRAYLQLIQDREPVSAHVDAVSKRIADFEQFATAHPMRMKWPDTQAVTATPQPVEVQPVAWEVRNVGRYGIYSSERVARDAVFTGTNACAAAGLRHDFKIHPLYAAAQLVALEPLPSEDTQLLDFLQESSCDLRSIEAPTGGDDSDIHWSVIQHHMAAPHEREIAREYSDDPRAAIRAAIKAELRCITPTSAGTDHFDPLSHEQSK